MTRTLKLKKRRVKKRGGAEKVKNENAVEITEGK